MMTARLLWKRGPWEIWKTGDGRIRLDNGMHSDYPTLITSKTHPWFVTYDTYKVPKDVGRKVKSILIERELKARGVAL